MFPVIVVVRGLEDVVDRLDAELCSKKLDVRRPECPRGRRVVRDWRRRRQILDGRRVPNRRRRWRRGSRHIPDRTQSAGPGSHAECARVSIRAARALPAPGHRPPVIGPRVGTSAEGEPNPNRQNDQDDRADDSCGSEESHRDFIHWRIKTLPGFTASWAFSPVRDFLFLAKNLFVAATERGLRKHFAFASKRGPVNFRR